MKRILALLLHEPAWRILTASGVLVASLLIWALAACGSFSSIGFDEVQNSKLEPALMGQPPLPAIIAAREIGPAFADEVRKQLTRSANAALQSSETLDWDGTRPEDAAQAAWVDTYVCGLQGWREQRAILRKLVLDGYGECGWSSRFAARSPLLYGGGSWFFVLLPWGLMLLVLAATVMLMLVRRAYRWLYASNVVGRPG